MKILWFYWPSFQTVSHTHRVPIINDLKFCINFVVTSCLYQGLPPVVEMCPDYLFEPLRRGGQLLQDGVLQVVDEHVLIVVL